MKLQNSLTFGGTHYRNRGQLLHDYPELEETGTAYAGDSIIRLVEDGVLVSRFGRTDVLVHTFTHEMARARDSAPASVHETVVNCHGLLERYG